ncbi:MAG: hypothetical protein RR145_03665 [Oscillospiraceae bacterium]
MTNEEKILQLLGTLVDRQDQTDDKLTQMQGSITQIQGDISEMKVDISELKRRVTKIEITQENVVLPHIQLLAEGHTTIQGQIRKLSVIDSLQDDVSTLKSAVRFLSEEIQQMKNAM